MPKTTTEIREQKRQYREKNKESISAKKREIYKKNPAYFLKRANAWKEGNEERIRELSRVRYATRADVRQKVCANNRRAAGLPEPTRPEPEVCECCGNSARLTRHGRSTAASLDHCHTTGKFRGWLCRKCNLALGLLGDDIPRAISNLARYLEKTSQTTFGARDE